MRIAVGFLASVFLMLSGCSFFSSPPKEAKVEKPVLPPKVELKFDYLRPAYMVKDPKIFVYKSKRRMYVFDGDTIVRDYPIGLGKNPQGDKEREGDGKTPEGMFYVCTKNDRSKFYKSIGLSYPSLTHAEKALLNGLISVSDYRRVENAYRRYDTPPWDTPLGGYIFIHGGGAHSDWTEGCIALYNSDIDELFEMVRIGIPVYVYP